MFLPLELAMIFVFPLAESFGSFSIGKRIITSFVSLSISLSFYCSFKIGGDGRNRTDDLLNANQMLFQLIYIPNYLYNVYIHISVYKKYIYEPADKSSMVFKTIQTTYNPPVYLYKNEPAEGSLHGSFSNGGPSLLLKQSPHGKIEPGCMDENHVS